MLVNLCFLPYSEFPVSLILIKMTPLRKLREKRGYSLRYVAAACSINVGNYSRLERGLKNCSPEVAARLVSFFSQDVKRKPITELEILFPERYMD